MHFFPIYIYYNNSMKFILFGNSVLLLKCKRSDIVGIINKDIQ